MTHLDREEMQEEKKLPFLTLFHLNSEIPVLPLMLLLLFSLLNMPLALFQKVSTHHLIASNIYILCHVIEFFK